MHEHRSEDTQHVRLHVLPQRHLHCAHFCELGLSDGNNRRPHLQVWRLVLRYGKLFLVVNIWFADVWRDWGNHRTDIR